MSCYLHENDHIDLLVTHLVRKRITGFRTEEITGTDLVTTWESTPWGMETMRVTDLNATEVGRTLIRENVASVSHRYRGDLSADEIGAGLDYEHRATGYGLPAIAIIKAAKSYRYQACEHPEWETSLAKQLIDRLVDELLGDLPGYSEANTWTYDRPAHEPVRIL